MLEIILDNKVIHRSQNLRGLISHAYRAKGVSQAACYRTQGGAIVYVEFLDGAWCRTKFADFSIARDFLRKRWRKWGMFAETRCSDNYWEFR